MAQFIVARGKRVCNMEWASCYFPVEMAIVDVVSLNQMFLRKRFEISSNTTNGLKILKSKIPRAHNLSLKLSELKFLITFKTTYL